MALGDPSRGMSRFLRNRSPRIRLFSGAAAKPPAEGSSLRRLEEYPRLYWRLAAFDANVPPEYQDLLSFPKLPADCSFSISAESADAAFSALDRHGAPPPHRAGSWQRKTRFSLFTEP